MCAVSGGGNDEGVKQNIKPGRYWIHQAALRGEAPWWLQHVYNQQQDGDVQLMAEHALSVLTSEVRSQLEIYNVPVLSDCDHVPAVYGTDTTMAEEVAGTGIVLRAEKFRQQWNEAASFLIQLFRDVIKAFKEKRRSAGYCDR